MKKDEYSVNVSITISIKAESKTDAREKVNELLKDSRLDCTWDILETKSYDEVMND